MSRSVFNVVLVLMFYIPVEVFILKWLPVNELGYTILYISSELLIYGLLIYVLLGRAVLVGTWRRTPIDTVLLTFVAAAIMSFLLNGGEPLNAVDTLRPLLRYVALFYIMVNLQLGLRELRLTMMAILAVGLMEGGLALVQYFSGPEFNELFYPREVKMELGGQEGSHYDPATARLGAVAGTFTPGGVLGMFMLIPYCVLLVYWRFSVKRNLAIPLLFGVGFSLMLFGVAGSYKRLPLMLAALMPLAMLFFLGDRQRLQRALLLYGAGGVVVAVLMIGYMQTQYKAFKPDEAREYQVDKAALFTQLFTEEYWANNAESSRLWFLRKVSAQLLTSTQFLGYGPDANNAIVQLVKEDSEFGYLVLYDDYADVYWITMLMYFGIIGVALFIWILARLYRSARWLIKHSPVPEHRMIGLLFCMLFALTLLYNFAERTLLVRPYSFYLWLIAGLVVNCHYGLQRIVVPERRPVTVADTYPRLALGKVNQQV